MYIYKLFFLFLHQNNKTYSINKSQRNIHILNKEAKLIINIPNKTDKEKIKNIFLLLSFQILFNIFKIKIINKGIKHKNTLPFSYKKPFNIKLHIGIPIIINNIILKILFSFFKHIILYIIENQTIEVNPKPKGSYLSLIHI